MSSLQSPDLIIVFGPRGLLSLAGIILIVAGVWYTDRQWDERGSEAYHRAKNTDPGNEKSKLLGPAVEIPPNELRAAFPFPWAFLVGWTLFGLSFFSPIQDSRTNPGEFAVTVPAIGAGIVSLALGWIASVPMGDAVVTRNASKKQVLGLLFVFSWMVLTIVSGWGELSATHAIFRACGAIAIIGSMKILWKFRKMGDSWEQEGRANPNPVVYNMGGPLFVFGWFLFWIGVAASDNDTETEDPLTVGIPIYFTLRSALAFIAGCGMVPVVMFLDYAHDEGAEFLGFGTDGRFFGRFLESPIPFLLAWTLFGFSSWLPLGDSVSLLKIVILINCVAQGFDAGVLIQTALYKQDMAGKNRWSVPFVLLFLALALELGGVFGSSPLNRLWLSLPGAILIILGQKTVFANRKRGDYWMQTGEVNPNPIVYSYGEPLFMTGWILMSLVMAMPI